MCGLDWTAAARGDIVSTQGPSLLEASSVSEKTRLFARPATAHPRPYLCRCLYPFAAISLSTAATLSVLKIPQTQGPANFLLAASGVIFPSLIFST